MTTSLGRTGFVTTVWSVLFFRSVGRLNTLKNRTKSKTKSWSPTSQRLYKVAGGGRYPGPKPSGERKQNDKYGKDDHDFASDRVFYGKPCKGPNPPRRHCENVTEGRSYYLEDIQKCPTRAVTNRAGDNARKGDDQQQNSHNCAKIDNAGMNHCENGMICVSTTMVYSLCPPRTRRPGCASLSWMMSKKRRSRVVVGLPIESSSAPSSAMIFWIDSFALSLRPLASISVTSPIFKAG